MWRGNDEWLLMGSATWVRLACGRKRSDSALLVNLTLVAAAIIVHLLLILSLVRVLTETLKCYMTRSARLLTSIFGE